MNRAEIAHELTRHDSFSAIDRDGNGTIDPDEFQALLDSRAAGDRQPDEAQATSR